MHINLLYVTSHQNGHYLGMDNHDKLSQRGHFPSSRPLQSRFSTIRASGTVFGITFMGRKRNQKAK